jgi:hypothetical protein
MSQANILGDFFQTHLVTLEEEDDAPGCRQKKV